MKDKVCKISLFSFILACVSAMPSDAAVRVNNSARSRADAYQQLNELRAQQEYYNNVNTSAAANLPVMVDDERLANSIANNEAGAPNVSELEACSMIYPNGNFRWGTPEYGIQSKPTCIAVVELRDANSNAVLATTTVAAGQSIKCNIDYFPTSGYNMSALSKVELQADTEPTMEDVIAVMNEEQKQNAGVKIAAGAIIAGVAGNLLAPKDAGAKEGKTPFGTGNTQLMDTAIGAAAGAGIMAASTYSGKVAGDTIKSTAVNAASGMLIGNMMAGTNSSESVLATAKCSVGEGDSKTEYDCVPGKYEKYGDPIPTDTDKKDTKFKFYLVKPNGTDLKICSEADGASGSISCKDSDIKSIGKIFVKTSEGKKSLDSVNKEKNQSAERWKPVGGQEKDAKNNPLFEKDTSGTFNNVYYIVESAQQVDKTDSVYAVFENKKLNKPFGYKMEDWEELKKSNPKIYNRYTGGGVGSEYKGDQDKGIDLSNFKPLSRDADDGALIDLSNQARAKATIAGTALGGGLGGFAGYQGAKDEISERWVSSVREYNNSLLNFICVTGNRPLSKYNDYADIPALKVEE